MLQKANVSNTGITIDDIFKGWQFYNEVTMELLNRKAWKKKMAPTHSCYAPPFLLLTVLFTGCGVPATTPLLF